MNEDKPALWDRIRADPTAGDELRKLADEFEKAATGYYGEPQTVTVKQFCGAFARCRLAWCRHTGESLV